MSSIIDALTLSLLSFSLLWLVSIFVATLIVIISKISTLKKEEQKG